MTRPAPITNWPPATRGRLVRAIFEAALPVGAYRFEHRDDAWNVELIPEPEVPQQYVAPPDDAVLDFLVDRLSPALAVCKTIYGIEDKGPAPPLPDCLPTPAEAARKPRKPTLTKVAKQASKAGIEVARYEVKPDGTVVVITGQPEPVEPENPWLADLH